MHRMDEREARSREPLASLIRTAEQALSRDGVVGVLAWLNGRTRHRFTGLYVVESPILTNLSLYDRENPGLEIGGAQTRLRETYCSITAGGSAPFSTADAGQDERLTTHPARHAVLSYCGVPLLRFGGGSFGTLCHFDLRPRLVPSQEIPVMERVAELLARTVERTTGQHRRIDLAAGSASVANR